MTADPGSGAWIRQARILVVDDSTFVRKALRKVFEASPGLSVAGEAGDGHEAVRMCASLVPDIVTLDIQMPGMDGLAALREIKHRWPVLPVLVLASATSNGPEVVMEALSLGAFEFVDKARFRSMDFQLMGDEVVKKVRVGLTGLVGAPAPRVLLPGSSRAPRGARARPRRESPEPPGRGRLHRDLHGRAGGLAGDPRAAPRRVSVSRRDRSTYADGVHRGFRREVESVLAPRGQGSPGR
ncbi:MAG: response regulator [Holophagales bacterium]|nr:response regulator [Holophagales bacterium]